MCITTYFIPKIGFNNGLTLFLVSTFIGSVFFYKKLTETKGKS